MPLRASWDALDVANVDVKNHFARADNKSPNGAAGYQQRKSFRNIARYECRNNSYCRGILATLSNDTIGRGARLQMQLDDQRRNELIEQDWKRWCRKISLAAKMRQMKFAKGVDGESIGLIVNNIRVFPAFDLRILEADYLHNPIAATELDQQLDGIRLDVDGYPVSYFLLDDHPGDAGGFLGSQEAGKWYPVSRIFHLLNSDRAGQFRGIPEIAPALTLFAILRRYTLAVLGAAEVAADISAVLKTNAPPDVPADDVEPFLTVEFARRAMLTMPFGWDVQQVRAEQPTTAYAEFKQEILNEIGRCLNMPLNIATASSADYSFASGRLDHQIYRRQITIEREQFEIDLLDPLFDLWIREYMSSRGRMRPSAVDPLNFPHRWVWDAFAADDPVKASKSAVELWDAGLLSDDEYLLEQGIDPEDHYRKQARMIERRRALDLPLPRVARQEIDVDDGDGDAGPGRPAKNGAAR